MLPIFCSKLYSASISALFFSVINLKSCLWIAIYTIYDSKDFNQVPLNSSCSRLNKWISLYCSIIYQDQQCHDWAHNRETIPNPGTRSSSNTLSSVSVVTLKSSLIWVQYCHHPLEKMKWYQRLLRTTGSDHFNFMK